MHSKTYFIIEHKFNYNVSTNQSKTDEPDGYVNKIFLYQIMNQ